jgi:hypothetical protein
MHNSLPVWDAELSACLDAFRGRVFYLPVQDAELPACMGYEITYLFRMQNYLLYRMQNYPRCLSKIRK